MKLCNKILTFSTLLLAFSIFADAQTYTERVAKDKEIAAESIIHTTMKTSPTHQRRKAIHHSTFPIMVVTDRDTIHH